MKNNNDFVAYEYKSVNATRDSAGMQIDCMENFGWILIENDGYDAQALFSNLNPVNLGRNIAGAAQTFCETADATTAITLKFKRDRRIENKQQLEKLEREYEAAMSAITRIGRKNEAQTMGVSLGIGIIGAVFVAISVYSFVASNILAGVLFAAVGAIGWAVGFFSNRKVGRKKSDQTEPTIREQLDIAYGACEQARALLA